MINILIVDDSETEIAILKHLFESEVDFKVVGCAKNGAEAVKLVALLKPHLITMDIHMPVMDGLEATRLIMSQYPTPIVVISSKLNDEALNATYHALEAGALSVLDKPTDIAALSSKRAHKQIIDTVRSMAEIKVITRRFQMAKTPTPSVSTTTDYSGRKYEVVCIGASIGGPQALKTILAKLPEDFPLPIVVVQHMTEGFINGFAQWLNDDIALQVKITEQGEVLRKGVVYFAPDGYHLEVTRTHENLVAKLTKSPPVAGFCPSITVLFASAAKICGKNAVGVLLTGMGHDGAHGLLELKKALGHTFIQDSKSAVVFGMAGVAQSLGAIDKVVELDQIADYLTKLA